MNKENSGRIKVQKIVSLLTITIGGMVLLYGIFVEDEPTLVAPLLIICGVIGYVVSRSKIRLQQT